MVSKISTDTKIVVALFVFLFSFYLLIMSGSEVSSPGFTIFQLSRAIVGQGSLTFGAPLRWGDEYRTTSFFGIGMSLAYIPALLPWRFLRPDLFAPNFFDPTIPYNPAILTNDLYLYASWTNPFITAAGCVLLYLLCRQLQWTRRWSLLAAGTCGLVSPYAVYARFDFAQNLMGLCLVGTLWLLRKGLATKNNWFLVSAGLVALFGVLTRLELILVVPWMLLLFMYYPERIPWHEWRTVLGPALVFSGMLALGFALYQMQKVLKLGSVLDTSYESPFEHPTYLIGLIGSLLSPGKGLIFYFPLVLVSALGMVHVIRTRKMPELVFLGIFLMYLVLYEVLWEDWPGGWSWGPRFLVAFVPLLSLLAVEWLKTREPLRNRQIALFAGLTVLSFIATANGILFNFLLFYGDLYANTNVAALNEFAFYPVWTSPLFVNWDWTHRLGRYDLFWLNRVMDNLHARSYTAVILFGLLVLIFGAAAFFVARYFRQDESPPSFDLSMDFK